MDLKLQRAWKVMISWEDGITDKCMPGRVAVFKDHMTNINCLSKVLY